MQTSASDEFVSWQRSQDTSFDLPSFDTAGVIEFHRRLPGYEETPLLECESLARRLGVKRLLLKLEAFRFGLPSFKILGASWAIHRALADRFGPASVWDNLSEVTSNLGVPPQFKLLAATDGNHGRAVARVASRLGLSCRIFVPAGTARSRILAIREEGASVTVVDGDYDAAVRQAAEAEDTSSMVVSDTSWPGYEVIPNWVSEGYATIFAEVDMRLRAEAADPVTTVAIPVGVGGLASAAIKHYRNPDRTGRPRLISVEPLDAACVLKSLQAGRPMVVPGPHRSIMAGLNCGTPSAVAWPLLRDGLDVAVAVGDRAAVRAMCALSDLGMEVGETGAAALAGLSEIVRLGSSGGLSQSAGLSPDATVLVLVTEGVTDPEHYEELVTGRSNENPNECPSVYVAAETPKGW